MLHSQTDSGTIQEITTHDTITLAAFLENDLEGYEYVKARTHVGAIPRVRPINGAW